MSPDSQIGTVVNGKYKLLALIGAGSTSTVFKAEHEQMKHIVALKCLKPDKAMDVIALKRFQLEAQAGSRCHHRSICAIYDFGITSQGQPFLVMELCDGKNLADLIAEKGTIQTPLAISIFLEVCEALEHIHGAGVVVRDINPTDIIVNIDGDIISVKLIDFGCVKIVSEAFDGTERIPTTEIQGRALYMSPEQCQGLKVDFRSDVYSLGCVMYEAIVGQPPIEGNSFLSTIYKQVSQAVPSFSTSRPDLAIPPEIEAIVSKAIEKDPAERYQSMSEITNALRQIETERQEPLH